MCKIFSDIPDASIRLKKWPAKFNFELKIKSQNVSALFSFNDTEVRLFLDFNAAGTARNVRDVAKLLHKIEAYKNQDTSDQSPLVVRNVIANRERWAALDARKAEIERKKTEAETKRGEEEEKRLNEAAKTRAYLSSIPLADCEHSYLPGKTERYRMLPDHSPWPHSGGHGDDFVLINNNRVLAVVGATQGKVLTVYLPTAAAPVKAQWLGLLDFAKEENLTIWQSPIFFHGLIADEDGEFHSASNLPNGLSIDTSLDMSLGSPKNLLPDNLTIQGHLIPHPSTKSLPRNLKAGQLTVTQTSISVISGDTEVGYLYAADSKLEKIEDGFKARHADLSRTYKLVSLPDDFEVEQLILRGSWVRTLPKKLKVHELDLKGAMYITEIPDCTVLHGKLVGDGSQVIDEDGQTPGLKW